MPQNKGNSSPTCIQTRG